jgi:hypothetical protein
MNSNILAKLQIVDLSNEEKLIIERADIFLDIKEIKGSDFFNYSPTSPSIKYHEPKRYRIILEGTFECPFTYETN